MLMLGARVGLFENDQNMLFLAKWGIQQEGHVLVPEAVAETKPKALEVIEGLALGRIAIDVLVLDGNLTEGATDGDDAIEIAARMHDLGVLLPVIGFSSRPFAHYDITVARDAGKKPAELGKVISSIATLAEAA